MKTSQRTHDQDIVIAIHEAAHCVAAVVLKRGWYYVTIEKVHDSDGHWRYIRLARNASYRKSVADIICCLAGPIAEVIANESPDHLPEGYETDLLDALHRIVRIGTLEEFVQETFVLLLDHWDKVQLVASALLDARTLTAHEVRQILKPCVSNASDWTNADWQSWTGTWYEWDKRLRETFNIYERLNLRRHLQRARRGCFGVYRPSRHLSCKPVEQSGGEITMTDETPATPAADAVHAAPTKDAALALMAASMPPFEQFLEHATTLKAECEKAEALTPERAALFDQYTTALNGARGEFEDEVAKVICEHLTAEEVDLLLAFYASPARKAVEKALGLAGVVSNLSTAWQTKVLERCPDVWQMLVQGVGEWQKKNTPEEWDTIVPEAPPSAESGWKRVELAPKQAEEFVPSAPVEEAELVKMRGDEPPTAA